MDECLICFNDKNLINLPLCSCLFCQDCALAWHSVKIQQISFKLNEKINCPNEKCSIQYDVIKDLIQNENLEPKLKSAINEELFKKYLQSTADIFSCPKVNCHYYGFNNLKSDACDYPHKCDVCGSEWCEAAPKNFIFEKITKVFKIDLSDFFSNIYEEAFTESCPECSVYISRNGGCNHMTCKNCKYEFCWYCKQKYVNHNLNICMTHLIVKNYINFIITFLMICKFGWHVIILEALYAIFLFILKYGLLFNLLGFYFGVYLKYLCYFLKATNDQKKKRKIIFSLFGFVSLYLIYFLNQKGLLVEMIFAWMIEVVIIATLYVLTQIGRTVYNSWIAQVK